jgi:hypothetical protein
MASNRNLSRISGSSLCFRALPTKTNVESGTSQSKSGTSVNFSNSGQRQRLPSGERVFLRQLALLQVQGYLAHNSPPPPLGPYSRPIPRALWWS